MKMMTWVLICIGIIGIIAGILKGDPFPIGSGILTILASISWRDDL